MTNQSCLFYFITSARLCDNGIYLLFTDFNESFRKCCEWAQETGIKFGVILDSEGI